METKVCVVCNLDKPVDAFHWTGSAQVKRRNNCKDCSRKNCSAVKGRNRDRWRAYEKKRRQDKLAADPVGTRAAHAAYMRQRMRDARQQVIAHLGGRCCRCGFDDWRALQVDHVLGGGVKERKAARSSYALWRLVLKDKTGKYQLLCANCNWIKRYENGEGCKFGDQG